MKTKTVQLQVPKNSVVITFNQKELFYVFKILDLFTWQEDRVWKTVGIKTLKQEKILTDKMIEMENIYLENFDHDYVFKKMQDGDLHFPHQQI